MAASIWGFGRILNAPHSARWAMLGLLYVAVLAVHLVLPDQHPIRMATGESALNWLAVGLVVGLIAAYRMILGRVRAKAEDAQAKQAPQAEPSSDGFSETELNRYARHIVLREIGGSGQMALRKGRVLVIGAGGLGAPALQYLAAAGVGTIGVIDDDVVENTNLQRQVIHTDARIGMPKVFSAQLALEAQNPHVTIKPYNRRLTDDIAADLFAEYDVILDGTDNFDTRYLVNRHAVSLNLPLVSGALTQWEGQVSVFDAAKGAPCYQCVFPQAPSPELAPSCAEAGVLSPLPGVVGSMMAVECIKVLTGAGAALRGQMAIYDALYGENRTIALSVREGCPACADRRN